MNLWPSRDFLDCLGWTLLHFLWQGLVIAALLAVALRLLRRRSANLRYLAGCGALLLMAVAPVASFYSLSRQDETPALQFVIKKSAATYGPETIAPPSGAPRQTPLIAPKPAIGKPTIAERLEALLPWFVAAWSLGVLALSCRLFAGWLLIQRLRHTATTALTGAWQAKLQELARRVGVSRPLRLLQSAWVEVPTVIGWLRPVILLPASCLTGLTPAQLESILAHELAHIRRHDYLINVLQNVVETLLFYHPAVWWVSRRIRAEREHCCDDLAVKICGDAIEYARALATLEELRPAPAQLALAAGGAPLLERIRRLAGQPERSAIRPAWPVAGIIAVLLLALLATGLRNNPASAQSATEAASTNQLQVLPVPTNALAVSNHASFTTQLKSFPPATNGGAQVGASGGPLANPAGLGAIPTGHRSSFTSQLKKLPPQTNAAILNDEESIPQINLKTRFAEWDASKVGTNGSGWLFKDGGAQNLTNLAATFQFSEFLLIQPTNAAESEYRIFLHTNSSSAPLATAVVDTQYRSVIENLEQKDGVDILTAPEVTTELGRQVQVQAVDLGTILVGDPRSNGVPAVTNQLFGPVVDMIPRLAADGHTVELTLLGTISEFVGYEDPATITNQAGKPMPKNWAIPHFRVRQFVATASVDNAQTLVLGSGATPITTTAQTKSKVPLLGDIPLLGRAFRSTKTTTNTVQQNLMLMITPTLINADGTRYHYPDERHEGQANGTTNASIQPKLVHTSKGRQAILSKLDHIRVENIAYDNLPLGEVINNLSAIAQAKDPEKIGINFFISHEAPISTGAAPGSIDPATGLPVAPMPTATNTDLGSVTININHALKDVRLADVLDAVTRCADTPIKYSILDYAVVFSLRGPEPIPLEIRTYHVDPDVFRNGLASITGFSAGGIATNGSYITNSSTNLDQLQVSVRNFFSALGVDFSTNNAANVGKAFIWNDRKGMLTVRSTAQDLDLIGAAIETLNEAPPKVSTHGKYTETIEADSRIQSPIPTNGIFSVAQPATNQAALEIRTFHIDPVAFRQKLGIAPETNAPFKTNSPGEFYEAFLRFFASVGVHLDTINSTNAGTAVAWSDRMGVLRVRATHSDLEKIASAIDAHNLGARQISFKVKVVEFDTGTNDNLIGTLWRDQEGTSSSAPSNTTLSTISGILTESQYNKAIQALSQRKNAQLRNAPGATTISGRPAHLELLPRDPALVGASNGLVAVQPDSNSNSPIVPHPVLIQPGTQFPPYYNVVLDVTPRISEDGYFLDLNVVSSLPEFIGYDRVGQLKTDIDGKPVLGELPGLLPHYRLRQLTSAFTILDGQTAVIGGVLMDLPPESPGKQNKSKKTPPPIRKTLMIFITPTIINPDGTACHTAKEIAHELEQAHR